MENTPINPKAQGAAIDRSVAPIMRGNKLMILMALQTIAIAVLGGAIYQMIPLKTVEPYIMRVDATGRTESANDSLEQFNVNDAQKAYFLSRWIESFMSLKKDRVEEGLKNATRFTRGVASKKLADWIKDNNPLAASIANPNLDIHTQIIAVNAIGDDQALIRFQTVTRGEPNASAPTKSHWSLTAKFILVKPATAEEADFNPVGLYVVDYSLTKELAQ